MKAPNFLSAPDSQEPLAQDQRSMPRILVCTAKSKLAEDGKAKPGDVVLADTLEPVTQPVSVVGKVHYWAVFPKYTPAGDNTPTAEFLDSPANRARPECQWFGDEKPVAAEIIRLILWSPATGLRALVCQRQAVRAAQAVLREIDQLQTVIYGPTFRLTAIKQGRSHVPNFDHVGFVTEEQAKDIQSLATAIEPMLTIRTDNQK